MENIDLGALVAMIEGQARHISRVQRQVLEEAKTAQFKNPRFTRPADPRLPYLIVGSDEKSPGYKLELLIEHRFADLVRKKIALSDDFYLDLLLLSTKIQTKEDLDSIEKQLGEYHGYMWSSEVWTNFKKDAAFFAGYFDISVRMKVEEITGEVHPILGPWTNINDLDIVAIADKWNRQFIEHEQQLKAENDKILQQAKENSERLEKEKRYRIEKGLSHHSNKVRRRTKKKYGDNR